jgi:hypothetical protein
MAKIHTETLVVTFNRLIKDGDTPQPVATDEVVAAMAQVAEELAGAGVVVEAERA